MKNLFGFVLFMYLALAAMAQPIMRNAYTTNAVPPDALTNHYSPNANFDGFLVVSNLFRVEAGTGSSITLNGNTVVFRGLNGLEVGVAIQKGLIIRSNLIQMSDNSLGYNPITLGPNTNFLRGALNVGTNANSALQISQNGVLVLGAFPGAGDYVYITSNAISMFDPAGQTVISAVGSGQFSSWVSTPLLTNVTTGSIAVTQPMVSRSSSTNAPANNEFPTAGWVRSLFENGLFYYNSTNLGPGFMNGAVPFLYLTNLPAAFSRTYTAPTNNQYLGAVMITNQTGITGPIAVSDYLCASGGSGNPSMTVHCEIYYTYDNTNLLGDWVTAPHVIDLNVTNLHQFIVSVPTTAFTNKASIVRVYKADVVAGATRPNLVIVGGTNFPSSISTPSPGSSSSTVTYSATNLFYSTNMVVPLLTWPGPTNSLDLNGGTWQYTAGGDVAITNVTSATNNYTASSFLLVSNSTGGAITLRLTTSTWRQGGAQSTNALSIGAGKIGSLWVLNPGLEYNLYFNGVEP